MPMHARSEIRGLSQVARSDVAKHVVPNTPFHGGWFAILIFDTRGPTLTRHLLEAFTKLLVRLSNTFGHFGF